jgi:hypothetical protein
MPITITFDEATLPPMLDGLVRAERSLQATHELFEGFSEYPGVEGDFKAAMTAVESVRTMIDEAVMRAVAESN